MWNSRRQASCGATLLAWLAAGHLVIGCGDEKSPGMNQPNDTAPGDTEVDGGATLADVELMRLHCPGVVDENKGQYYCIINAGEITRAAVAGDEALIWIPVPGIPYVLDGRVFIGNGLDETLLTIMPGTTILGNPVTDLDNASSLIIQRNSKIVANGTAEAPILFTSANAVGSRANDDWGGIVINGNAPINACNSLPCEASGEGETGTYGGEDPDDSSGTISYARIEFSGKRLTADKEFNGLALQGVGRGTDIHHIQIHRAGDDSIEFFGGTAEVHHLLLTGTGDDSFDWVNGWTGKAQFIIAKHIADIQSDHGIEADNNESNFDYAPRANPILYNFTFYNTGSLLLRRGTAGTLANLLIDAPDACLDVADSVTWDLADTGQLTIHHSAVTAADCFVDDDIEKLGKLESTWWASGEGNRVVADPMLTDPESGEAPSFLPLPGSPVLEGAAAPPAGDAFFETVSYVGAMGTEDWTAGWTAFPVS